MRDAETDGEFEVLERSVCGDICKLGIGVDDVALVGAFEAVEELEGVAKDEEMRAVKQRDDVVQKLKGDRGEVLCLIDDDEAEAGEGDGRGCASFDAAAEKAVLGDALPAKVAVGKAVDGADVDGFAYGGGDEIVALSEHVLLETLVVGEEGDLARGGGGAGRGEPADGGGEGRAGLAGACDGIDDGVAGPFREGGDDGGLLVGQGEAGHGASAENEATRERDEDEREGA